MTGSVGARLRGSGLGVSGSVWEFLGESIRRAWESLGVSGRGYEWLGACESACEILGESGGVCERLGGSGRVSECLEASGSVWECLGVSGRVLGVSGSCRESRSVYECV